MTADNDWFPTLQPEKKKRPRLVQPGETGAPAFERGDHLEVAQHLLRSLAPTPQELATDEGAMYRYDGPSGLWRELDKSTLACAVHPFAGRKILHGDREKILKVNSGTVDGAIEQAQHITRRVDFFASAPLGLAFSDGFVHATPDGLEWAEHAPEHRARVGYTHTRAACLSQPCPRWLEFLRQVWPAETKDAEGRELSEEAALASACDQEAKILLLQQFLGACLVGVATRYQLCLVMVGEGSNGKSTLIKVAEALFPAGTVAHVAPQDMGDEYRLALLAGKRFNTVGELPTSEIMASERFKAIVAGDEVTARQIRQEPITFQPRAGHMYAANKLPPVADMSHGFWSRFVVLRFAQTFQRGANARELWAEMVEAEGPAIIGWMLEGAASVLAARGYTLPPSSKAEIEAWRKKADSVSSFLDECCELPGPEDKRDDFWTSGSILFGAYSKWTDESKLRGVSKQTFAERMAGLGYPMKRTAAARTYPVNLKREFQRG